MTPRMEAFTPGVSLSAQLKTVEVVDRLAGMADVASIRGMHKPVSVPVYPVPSTPERKSTLKCTAVAAGKAHTLMLGNDGGVFVLGSGTHGRLGIGTELTYTVPTQVTALQGTRTVQVRSFVRLA